MQKWHNLKCDGKLIKLSIYFLLQVSMTKANTGKYLNVYFIWYLFIAAIIKIIMYFITNNFDKYYAQNVIFTAEIQSIVQIKLALPINFIFKVLLENRVNNSTYLIGLL